MLVILHFQMAKNLQNNEHHKVFRKFPLFQILTTQTWLVETVWGDQQKPNIDLGIKIILSSTKSFHFAAKNLWPVWSWTMRVILQLFMDLKFHTVWNFKSIKSCKITSILQNNREQNNEHTTLQLKSKIVDFWLFSAKIIKIDRKTW